MIELKAFYRQQIDLAVEFSPRHIICRTIWLNANFVKAGKANLRLHYVHQKSELLYITLHITLIIISLILKTLSYQMEVNSIRKSFVYSI